MNKLNANSKLSLNKCTAKEIKCTTFESNKNNNNKHSVQIYKLS